MLSNYTGLKFNTLAGYSLKRRVCVSTPESRSDVAFHYYVHIPILYYHYYWIFNQQVKRNEEILKHFKIFFITFTHKEIKSIVP